MNTAITVTKIETAHRQLRTAIELWFADGDPISIHTLAAASHQIIHDLNKKNNGPSLLFDSEFIKKEYRKKFADDIRHASNFMKHADRDVGGAAATLEFRPESNDNFIMFSIFGIQYLGKSLGAEELAFERWHTFRNPNLMSDAGKAQFEKAFTVAQRETFRTIKKHKFLEEIRLLISKPDVQKR